MGFTFKWAEKAIPTRTKRLYKVQGFVDDECLRYGAQLIPLRTGNLKYSGQVGTVIGSGLVRYIAPYAHDQYYNTRTWRDYDPMRGGRWFERMKTAHKADIKKGAQAILDGKQDYTFYH